MGIAKLISVSEQVSCVIFDIMLFEDTDLGIDASIIIDKLTIKEGGQIPEYTITLRNEKTVGTIQRLQQQIDSIANGQGGGGYNASQIRELIKSYGKDLFLSKVFPDIASGLITFLRGWQSKGFAAGMTGAGVGTVNGSELHADKLLARKYIEVLSLVVSQMFWRGGRQVLSPAGMKVSRVEAVAGGWRLYMETGDGQVNTFTVGAQAQVNRYGAEQRYWWRLVTAVGADYIDVSKADCDEGSVAPAVADEVVQMGHRTDPQLQWCVMDSSFSEDAGRTIYTGIDSYTLEGKLVLREGVDPNDPGRIGLFLPDGTEISTVIGELQQQIDDFGEGLRMEIDAEEGNLVDQYYDGDLVATVWRQWKDITSTVTRWVWTRQSGTDEESLASDALWNDGHKGVDASRLRVGWADIRNRRTKFVCDATVGGAAVRGVFG